MTNYTIPTSGLLTVLDTAVAFATAVGATTRAAIGNTALTQLAARARADGPQFVDGNRWLPQVIGTITPNSGTAVLGVDCVWVREFAGNIYARWFGAKGDNIIDDTAAIQAGLNLAGGMGGATVQLDRGTYYLASQIVMPDFVTLQGITTGAGSTGPGGGYIPAVMLDGHGRTGALISFPNTSADAQVSSQYVTLKNLAMRSAQFGISGNTTYYVARWIIQDCDFQASLTTGIYANLFYAVVRDNMFGYHGAPVGGSHTALSIQGTNNLPANGNAIRDNRFYHCAGATGYHLLLNLAPSTKLEGNIYEAGDSTSRHINVTNSDGCSFYQDWFEGSLAPYMIEFGGTITTTTFDHCTWVGTANTQALIANSTGSAFQLNLLNNRYLGLYKFLNADNTVYRETRLTAGPGGNDGDIAVFEGPQPLQQTYRVQGTVTPGGTIGAGNPVNPRDFSVLISGQVYPYPVVDKRAASATKRGMVYRSAPLTVPSPAYTAITAAATYTQTEEQVLRDKVEALRVRLGDLETKLTAAGILT